MLDLSVDYDKISRSGVIPYGHFAACRAGQVLVAVADESWNCKAPPPPEVTRLGPDCVQMFEKKLRRLCRKMVIPFLSRAKKSLENCLRHRTSVAMSLEAQRCLRKVEVMRRMVTYQPTSSPAVPGINP